LYATRTYLSRFVIPSFVAYTYSSAIEIRKNNMNNFRSSDRPRRGRDSFRRDFGRRESRHEMFDAVCDNCGKDCKVPFKPSSDKPIYCSDCFEKMGDQSTRRGPRRDSGRRESASQGSSDGAIIGLSKSIETLTSKLDSIIALLSANRSEINPSPAKIEKKEVEVITEKSKGAKTTKAKTSDSKKASKTKSK
jgi:CxxC-x17-CxxC domain-containing protein